MLKIHVLLSTTLVVCICSALSRAGWIGELYNVDPTIMFSDLTYPGAHDALTGDLGTEIPYYGDISALARIWPFRHLSSAGAVIRSFSQTQTTNVTSILNGGIRLLDLRAVVKERVYDPRCLDGEWYGYHGVVTAKPFQEYIRELSAWTSLPEHRSEIVIAMVSFHGDNECVADCWNSIPPACVKRLFTDTVSSIGPGAIFNGSQYDILRVGLDALIQSNRRIVLLWSDTRSISSMRYHSLAVDLASTTCQDSCTPTLSTGSLKDVPGKKADLDKSFESLAGVDIPDPRLSIMGLENSILPCVAKVGALRLFDSRYCLRDTGPAAFGSEWCDGCETCFNMPLKLNGCPWITMPSNAALVNYYTQRSLDNVVRNPDRFKFPSILYQDMVTPTGRVIIDPYNLTLSAPFTESIILSNFQRLLPNHTSTMELRASYDRTRPVQNLPESPGDGIYAQEGANKWPVSDACVADRSRLAHLP
jgi:hypothetical protein